MICGFYREVFGFEECRIFMVWEFDEYCRSSLGVIEEWILKLEEVL